MILQLEVEHCLQLKQMVLYVQYHKAVECDGGYHFHQGDE